MSGLKGGRKVEVGTGNLFTSGKTGKINYSILNNEANGRVIVLRVLSLFFRHPYKNGFQHVCPMAQWRQCSAY